MIDKKIPKCFTRAKNLISLGMNCITYHIIFIAVNIEDDAVFIRKGTNFKVCLIA